MHIYKYYNAYNAYYIGTTTLLGFGSLFSEIMTSNTEDFCKLIDHYDIDLIDHNNRRFNFAVKTLYSKN